ncbi:hypothetical protein [Paenibacillus campi]|uniref:hypothetical protein n=1 Tax=Paenibacillus campi TaxID=3106031 RepID=UPI002AFEB14F|nr:hypothetical protein [Paenibacillus sp. SGZ-1014]
MVALAFVLITVYVLVFSLVIVFGLKFIGERLKLKHSLHDNIVLIVGIPAIIVTSISLFYLKSPLAPFVTIVTVGALIRIIVDKRKAPNEH